MSKQLFLCGQVVKMSDLGALNEKLYYDLREHEPLTITEHSYLEGEHLYKVAHKTNGTWAVYNKWVKESELQSAYSKGGLVDNPITPARYGGEGTDLIAMWSKIMKPNEFRRTMFSHITKYLFRYPDKNNEEDFNKAMEFIRRLKDYEENTGNYGKEESK